MVKKLLFLAFLKVLVFVGCVESSFLCIFRMFNGPPYDMFKSSCGMFCKRPDLFNCDLNVILVSKVSPAMENNTGISYLPSSVCMLLQLMQCCNIIWDGSFGLGIRIL